MTKLDAKALPYAYVSPFFLLFFAFGLFPLVYTGWVSLHSVALQNTDEMEWVGLDNYSRLIHDDAFWNALMNTFTIGLISTVPQLLIALVLAHLLSYKLRGSTFFRVSMLMPYATSVAAATIVFAHALRPGLRAHQLVPRASSASTPSTGRTAAGARQIADLDDRDVEVDRLQRPHLPRRASQAIPKELYEAAAVDGASRWQQLRHVTVPGIKP